VAKRVTHAGLRLMVDRLGFDRVAKRFKITPRTVGNWVIRGVPIRKEKAVTAVYGRHERARAASKVAVAYRKHGWKRLKTFADVDKVTGLESGHSQERWTQRKEWWDEHRPLEDLPKRVAFIVDKEGRLLYVNGDQVLWRGYTVTSKKTGEEKLFWTMATYLDGYDTAEEFIAAYESLGGTSTRIHFGDKTK